MFLDLHWLLGLRAPEPQQPLEVEEQGGTPTGANLPLATGDSTPQSQLPEGTVGISEQELAGLDAIANGGEEDSALDIQQKVGKLVEDLRSKKRYQPYGSN